MTAHVGCLFLSVFDIVKNDALVLLIRFLVCIISAVKD